MSGVSNSMMDKVLLSAVTKKYVTSFHQCVAEVARERKYLAIVEPPDVEVLYDAIESGVAKKLPITVGVSEGTVIGWCSIARNQREGFWHSGILGIGVRQKFRCHGIGKRLLSETLTKAQDLGISRIELEVFASNKVAVEFYQKQGFEVEGLKRKARFLDGSFDDTISMAVFV